MERHIVEILVLLMKQFPEGAIHPDDFEPLTNDLIQRGYTQNEIETAFFWFYNRQEVSESIPETDAIFMDSYRVLHNVERSILSAHAHGFLLELRHLGLLNLSELNMLIEKAVLLGGRNVSLDEMKILVADHLMEREQQFQFTGQSFLLKTPTETLQ